MKTFLSLYLVSSLKEKLKKIKDENNDAIIRINKLLVLIKEDVA